MDSSDGVRWLERQVCDGRMAHVGMCLFDVVCFFFFFQAEDGIRDKGM